MVFLAGYNGTPAAQAAVRLAAEQARVFGAELEVVEVVAQDPALDYKAIERKERRLKDETAQLVGDRLPASRALLLLSTVSAGEQLVEHARQIGAGQIFLGVRRRSKVGKFVFGSTAQYVLLNADCPVVTTR